MTIYKIALIFIKNHFNVIFIFYGINIINVKFKKIINYMKILVFKLRNLKKKKNKFRI